MGQPECRVVKRGSRHRAASPPRDQSDGGEIDVMLKIFSVYEPCLRAKCNKVSRVTNAERRILNEMAEMMQAANGIGLAAPQVGILQRMIVVDVDDELFALVNPEVVDSSDETETMEEGCLSMPNYYGPVERPERVTVRALDRNGKKVRIKADGLLARCLQHEIDHLDGILFFDPSRMRSLSDLRYAPPESEEEAAAQNGGDSDAGVEASQVVPAAETSRIGAPLARESIPVGVHDSAVVATM